MKITENTKKKIIRDYFKGITFNKIAETHGVSRRSVGRIISEYQGNISTEQKTSETIDIHEEVISKDEKVLKFSLENKSKTLSDILSEKGYDISEWTVKNIYHNEWQAQKANNEGLVTLYQFKVHLVKKDLIDSIGNITINISDFNNNKPVKRCFKKAVIIPDIQCGFRRDLNTGKLIPVHDRVALSTALALTKEINPDRIIFLGDNLDLAEMSTKYTPSPDFYFTTQASGVELSWWLGQFRKLNQYTMIDYLAGNHESRIERLLAERAMQFQVLKPVDELNSHNLFSIERFLGLDKLDINYYGPYPSGQVAINKNLVCIHGNVAKGESGATVSTVVRDARVSIIQGHIHRYEVATKTVWDAYNNYHMYTAASFGCLCSIEPGVVPGMKYQQNWQQGIGVVTYEEDGKEEFRQEFIPIIRGRSIYNDKEFIGKSEVDTITHIEKDTNFKVS